MLMVVWHGIAGVVLALFPLLSSAQGRPLPNPIGTPAMAWAFDGFVVTIPGGSGWYSLAKDARYADLAKRLSDGTQAAAIVEASKADDSIGGEATLLAMVKKAQATPGEPATMKLMDYSAESFAPKGALCARWQAKFDDRRSIFPEPGILLVRGVSCVPPGQPDVLVTLQYAQRSARADFDPELRAEADPFVESLKFLPSTSGEVQKARQAVRGDKPEQAVDLLRPLADEGDGEAAVFLGNIFLYGHGVKPDYDQARKWLELAAREGRVDALYNLGSMYDKGIGTERDVAQAMHWFGLAADQRDEQAQLNLALFYLKGDGVPKNVPLAEAWLRRAAGNGSKRAQGILDVGKYREQ
jgi:hypothetical protein